MISKQLIEYIKSERAKGVQDDIIKSNLLDNDWAESDIEEAFQRITSIDPNTPFDVEIKDRENVFVIDSEESHPATVVKEDIEIPLGEKPKVMPNVISILLIVISFLFMYKAGMMVTIMSIVDRISYSTGTIYYFLKEFPLYGWVIMAFVLSSSIFLYMSFKIRTGTKSAFWLCVLSLLIFPISLSYVNYKLMYSVAQYFSSESIILGTNAPRIPTETSTLVIGVLGEPAFFISFITLVLLLISFKKFHYLNSSLSFKDIKILIVLMLLFTIPTAFIVYSGYSKIKNDDFGYKKAKFMAGYHIYRPDPIPLGMVHMTNFMANKELAGRKYAVQVTYGFAFEKAIDINKSRPIVLKQVGIKGNFSLDEFLLSESEIYSSQETLKLENAKNEVAYLIKKGTGSKGVSKTLIYVTSEDVLIHISTVDSSENDLIEIAMSLK